MEEGYYPRTTEQPITELSSYLSKVGGMEVLNRLRGESLQRGMSPREVADAIILPLLEASTVRKLKPADYDFWPVRTFLDLCKATQPVGEAKSDMLVQISEWLTLALVGVSADGQALSRCMELSTNKSKVFGISGDVQFETVMGKAEADIDEFLANVDYVNSAFVYFFRRLDGGVCAPLFLRYNSDNVKVDNIAVEERLKEVLKSASTCRECLQALLNGASVECNSHCDDCTTEGAVCSMCSGLGHNTIDARFRPCSRCLANGKHCFRMHAMTVALDSDPGMLYCWLHLFSLARTHIHIHTYTRTTHTIHTIHAIHAIHATHTQQHTLQHLHILVSEAMLYSNIFEQPSSVFCQGFPRIPWCHFQMQRTLLRTFVTR